MTQKETTTGSVDLTENVSETKDCFETQWLKGYGVCDPAECSHSSLCLKEHTRLKIQKQTDYLIGVCRDIVADAEGVINYLEGHEYTGANDRTAWIETQGSQLAKDTKKMISHWDSFQDAYGDTPDFPKDIPQDVVNLMTPGDPDQMSCVKCGSTNVQGLGTHEVSCGDCGEYLGCDD